MGQGLCRGLGPFTTTGRHVGGADPASWSRVHALLPLPGELHLTPLHGILQLRPSFSYLDKADAKHREREAANEGELWSLSPAAGVEKTRAKVWILGC